MNKKLREAIEGLNKATDDLEAKGISLSISFTNDKGEEEEHFLTKKSEGYPLPKDFPTSHN